eukprot:1815148-Alexandrium_andersonii.AAC.1
MLHVPRAGLRIGADCSTDERWADRGLHFWALSGNRGTACIARACTVLIRHDHVHSHIAFPCAD